MNDLSLPWPPKDLSPNSRTHWAKRSKAAKAYRSACCLAASQFVQNGGWPHLPTIGGDIHLWIDFYPPDRRHRDDDNMIAAFKAGRDGIADALGINDRRFRTHPFVKGDVMGMVKVRITGGPD